VARYTCRWLDERGWPWPWYHRWRVGFAEDRDGVKAFVAVVGKTTTEVEGEWERWARASR
jgi:hypothetical protein